MTETMRVRVYYAWGGLLGFVAVFAIVVALLALSGCKTLPTPLTPPGGTPASQGVSDAGKAVGAEGVAVRASSDKLRAEVPAIQAVAPKSGGVVAGQVDALVSVSDRLAALSGVVKTLAGQVAVLEKANAELAKTNAGLNAEIVKLKAASKSRGNLILYAGFVLCVLGVGFGVYSFLTTGLIRGAYISGAAAACAGFLYAFIQYGRWIALAGVVLCVVIMGGVAWLIVAKLRAGVLANAKGIETTIEASAPDVAAVIKKNLIAEQKDAGVQALVNKIRGK